VLQQKAATGRRRSSKPGAITVIPNLFAGEGRVHCLDSTETEPIDRLFTAGNSTSALIRGDTENVLSRLPSGRFQSCVTSPPYWSLRDYNIPGQIGLEDSVFAYIDHLVKVFAQVRRVLRDDGTLWLNIGDSYTSGGRTWRDTDKKNPIRAMNVRPATPEGLKPKDLIGVPWLLAFALQKEGWYLRADIIWNKPNCQPESVKDRPTRSHEYIFLFSKSEHYRYDASAVRGPKRPECPHRLGHPHSSLCRSPLRHISAVARGAMHQAGIEPARSDPGSVHRLWHDRPRGAQT
jgi:hypothetical protein